jgi:beta-mannanase
VYKNFNKPILFTEIGYKSEATATIKPWEWGSVLSILNKKKSNKTQRLAYEAFFNKVWEEPWFAGAYFWEWNTQTTDQSAELDLDFSPRFKPAENAIAKGFGRPVRN